MKLNSEAMLNFFVALSWISLRAVVLNQGDFAPLWGTFGSVWGLFWLSQLREASSGEGPGMPYNAQDSPHNKYCSEYPLWGRDVLEYEQCARVIHWLSTFSFFLCSSVQLSEIRERRRYEARPVYLLASSFSEQFDGGVLEIVHSKT